MDIIKIIKLIMAFEAMRTYIMRCFYYEMTCPYCGVVRYTSDEYEDDYCDYHCRLGYDIYGKKDYTFPPGYGLEMFTKEDLERFGGKRNK